MTRAVTPGAGLSFGCMNSSVHTESKKKHTWDALFISQRIVTNEKPALLSIFATCSLLLFKRNAPRKRFLPRPSYPLEILGVKQSRAKVR